MKVTHSACLSSIYTLLWMSLIKSSNKTCMGADSLICTLVQQMFIAALCARGFSGGLVVKNPLYPATKGKNPLSLPCNAGDASSIPGSGRFPEGGNGNPLQYSYLGNPMGQRSLVSYSPWDCKRNN